MRIKKHAFFIIGMLALFTMGNSNCRLEGGGTQEKGEKLQEGLMQRAEAKVPVPDVNNFRTRQAVAKWMRRMDTPRKTFYVYQYGMQGNIIHYWVASTRPISICSYLTPTQRVLDRYHDPDLLANAPSLDGVYANGSSGCEQVFFFTADTDALVMMNGGELITSDYPLRVKAEPIRVKKE